MMTADTLHNACGVSGPETQQHDDPAPLPACAAVPGDEVAAPCDTAATNDVVQRLLQELQTMQGGLDGDDEVSDMEEVLIDLATPEGAQ